MNTYFEQQPDHIPYQQSAKEFSSTLKILATEDGQIYADSKGLQVVAKVWNFSEKFFNMAGGRKDHTTIANVESGLAKFLYYGYAKGFIASPHFAKGLLSSIQTKHPEFSTTIKELLTLMDNQAGQTYDEKVRNQITGKLAQIHKNHGDLVDPLGGKTSINKGEDLTFGNTPLHLAKQALTKKDFNEALVQIKNALNLNIPTNSDRIGLLLIELAGKQPKAVHDIEENLEIFRDQALNQGKIDEAYKYEQARRNSREEDPSVLIRFATAASKLGETKKAAAYLEKAETLGGDVNQAKQALYLKLSQQAEASQKPLEALKHYEQAVAAGMTSDKFKFGKLHLKVAEIFYAKESSKKDRIFSSAKRSYEVAITHYEKAIELFSGEKKLIDALFQDNLEWARHYLESLKVSGDVTKGVKMIATVAENRSQFIKMLNQRSKNKDVRKENWLTSQLEGQVNKAIGLYQLAMDFDQTEGAYPFNIANWQDFLRMKYPNKPVPLALFEKAAKLDPDNMHYAIGVVQAYWNRDGHFKNTPRQYSKQTTNIVFRQIQESYFYENGRFLPSQKKS